MSEWQSYKIKDVGTVVTGNTPPTSKREFYGTEYKFIKPTDMQEGQRFVPETEEYYSELAFQKYQKSLLPKNTPCVVTIGSLGKKMCLTDEPSFTNQAVNAVIPNKEFDGVFLYYCLRTRLAYVKQLDSGTTSGRENVSKSSFSNITLKAPSLPTQKKIASVLSAYDNLIENNNKRIKISEQMTENLYKEWFVRFRFPGHETTPIENGIPKGWEVKKIKDCVKRLPFNQTYKANELEPEGKVIVVDQSADAYIGFHNNEPSHKANVESPILLFGDHSCKFVLMIKDFSLGENIVPFTSINADWLNPYYLFYATHKIIETTEYKRHWGQFVSMRILVPSSTLQQKFSDFMKSIHKELDELFIANMNLIKQRDLLLPRLMSGKLAVK